MRRFLYSLVLLLPSLGVHGGVILDFPLHPNYLAQLPFPYAATVLDNGPYSFSNLSTQFPQYNYAIVSPLIGYFDPYNPARNVIWTVPMSDFVVPEAQTTFGDPPICIGAQCVTTQPPPPPPPTPRPPTPPTPPAPTPPEPPQPPPPPCPGPNCPVSENTPEPATWTLGAIGLGIIAATFRRSRRKR